jgi:hypothetical protein
MTPGRPGPRVPQQRAGTQPSSQDAWIWRAHSCKLWLCPWMLPDSRGTIQNPMAKAGSPAGLRAEQAGAGAYDCITQDPERNEPVARGWCCLGRRVSLPLGVGEPVVTHVRRQTDRQAHTHTHTHTHHTQIAQWGILGCQATWEQKVLMPFSWLQAHWELGASGGLSLLWRPSQSPT